MKNIAIERTFHLGKKAYSYQLENQKDVILLGNSRWNKERNECELTFFYVVVDAGAALTLEGIPKGAKILGVYKSRSGKFKDGQFRDFDSQRYIKSRYREIFRSANRKRSAEEVLQVFKNSHDEYLRTLTNFSNNVTSAEEAEERSRAQSPKTETTEEIYAETFSVSPGLESAFGAPVNE